MGFSNSDIKTDFDTKQSVNLITIPSEYDNSSLFGKYLHLWVWGFWRKTGNKSIKPVDIHKCPKSCNSELIGEKLEYLWNEHVKKCEKLDKKPSLLWPVLKLFGPFYFFVSIFGILGYFFQVIQALFLGELLDLVNLYKNVQSNEEKDEKLKLIIMYGIGICITHFIYVGMINPYFMYASKVGMDIRIACSSLIYRKALKLSKIAFVKISVGNIVNYLSNDTSRFDYCLLHTPFFFYGPISAIIVFVLLYPYLNYVTIFGLAILLLYLPLQTFMGKKFANFRAATATLTDERTRLVNEFIFSIRIIKMYCYELPFIKRINKVRKMEINKIKQTSFLRAFNNALFYVSSKIIIFVIMSIWVIFYSNHLDSKTVFLTMALLNHVRLTITLMFPNSISSASEAMISFRRITKFLTLPERQDKLNSINLINSNHIELNIENLNCSYSDLETKNLFEKDDDDFFDKTSLIFDKDVLKNINLNATPGQLTIIIGPVGSGKSSMLLSILGELFINKGKIDIKGSLSYSSQEAWIFAGTVKENILFNSIYDADKYKEVVRVCALERDLTLFPQGDQTLIGDRGASLSGGQRTRINLARALYLDADIYLLDDPLSAVDPHVAKHIFKEAIEGYLKDKIVILVTHQLQFIKNANKILILKDGEQIAYDNYDNLINSNIDQLCNFISMDKNKFDKEDTNRNSISNRDVSFSSETEYEFNLEKELDDKNSDLKEEIKNQKNERFIKKESEDLLAGSLKSYGVYIKLGSSYWLGPLLIITFFIAQSLFTGSDYWLTLWTDSEQRKKLADENGDTFSNKTFVDNYTAKENVYFYSILMLLLFIFSLLRGSLFFLFCLRASIGLHNRMFRKIIRTPMIFFDTTNIGEVLNRFSRDIGIIDDILPMTAFDAFGIIATDIGVMVLFVIVNLWTLVAIIVLVILVLLIRSIYTNLARRVKIIEGICKSPVFTHLSSSLSGLTTIRAFNVQKIFENRFDAYQNDHSSAFWLYLVLQKWFLFYLDISLVLFVFCATFSMILFIDHFNSATIGLIITSSIFIAGGFQWCMRQFCEVEVQFTSVDRVNEYSSLIDEGNLESDLNKPPSDWPSKGKLEFKNVVMRYFKDEKPVLNNLNFTIDAEEKIGIVGRTGAGKSSIISALFRLTPYDGDIIIDGTNCKSIELHDLRSKLSIIPQEPVLFNGTIRYNLDPMNEHKDDELWKVLEQIQLAKKIEEMNQGLYAPITDGGSNFSVGQKQLICLGRAILRSNKILILDEATASVDSATDELIQKTIRTEFKNCTILTIAHRLNTVMDSSRIMVMDAGRIQEFDKPIDLIRKKDSLLNKMIQSTGNEMAKMIKNEIELSNSKILFENN